VHVFWYCEKWQPGGIQWIQVNLLRHMDTEHIHFDIVCSEDDTDRFDEAIHKANARKIISLDQKYNTPGYRTLVNIFAVRKLIRNGKYDVVHFNVCHGVELIYMFWAWLYRVPVRIAHCRNNGIGAGGKSRMMKRAAHEVCRRVFGFCANVRLANSDLAARWLYGKHAVRSGKVEIIRNGIDAKRYAFNAKRREELRKELGCNEKFVLGHVGHFNHQKNHDFLLRVFAALKKRIPQAVLLLVGEGEKEKEIRNAAEHAGILDSIIFYGVTDDVPGTMWAMDAFALPSHFEGFGNVLIEAQAAGLKCFASKNVIPANVRVCDLLEWISLENAPDEWADRIAEAYQPYVREDHSGDVVRAGYTIDGMARRLENLYLGCIAENKLE